MKRIEKIIKEDPNVVFLKSFDLNCYREEVVQIIKEKIKKQKKQKK